MHKQADEGIDEGGIDDGVLANINVFDTNDQAEPPLIQDMQDTLREDGESDRFADDRFLPLAKQQSPAQIHVSNQVVPMAGKDIVDFSQAAPGNSLLNSENK